MTKNSDHITKEDLIDFGNSLKDKIVLELMEKMEEKYVRKEDFDPVKKTVFSMIGLIVLTVFGALLTSVVKATL